MSVFCYSLDIGLFTINNQFYSLMDQFIFVGKIAVTLTCFMVYFGPKKHVPENDEMFLKNGIPVPDFASERSATL